MKSSCNFDLKVHGDMVVREQHITPTKENKMVNSSLDNGEMGMLRKVNQVCDDFSQFSLNHYVTICICKL